jgi:hypothetical protein
MAQVQLTTDVKNYDYQTLISGVTPSGETFEPRRFPVSVRPTSSNGSGVYVFGGNQNYLKLQVFSAQTSGLNAYIYGWNFCAERMFWVPQALWEGSFSFSAPIATVPFSTSQMYAGFMTTTSPGNNAGPTNSKELVFGTHTAGSTLMVDCVGAQFLELVIFNPTSGGSASTLGILTSSL